MSINLINQTLLNQFRVEAFVASGGMGAVYRVWDLKRNVPLAMKVLHADLADDPAVFRKFKREARALEKLAHPNIVPYYGLHQTEDFAFLLERFIDGPSLKDILRERKGKPLSIEETLTILKALCAALGYAHANGVVHCDVKPGNVMVDQGGNIYLTDFGVARHAESTTTTLGTAGTPAYMAPEQIRGEAVTPATDVYALGVMLFELLTGQRPFRGDEAGTESPGATAGERIRSGHLHLLPPDPRKFNPALTEALAAVVLIALAKDSKARFHSTQTFFQEICNAVGIPSGDLADRVILPETMVKGPPITYLSGDGELPNSGTVTPLRRPNLLIGVIVVGLVGLILLFMLLRPFGTRTDMSNPFTPEQMAGGNTQIATVSPSIEIPPGTESNLDLISTSPPATIPVPSILPSMSRVSETQGKIVFTCQIFKDEDRNQICIVNADGTRWRRLTPNDNDNHTYASLSPDGQMIVLTSDHTGNSEIYEMDLVGNMNRLTDNLGKLYAPEISPDGNWIVFSSTHDGLSTLWVMSRDGGDPHQIYAAGTGNDLVDPTWSPDNQQILFAMGSLDNKQLYVINRDGTSFQPITRGIQGIRGRSDWSPDGSSIATYIRTDSNDKWSREIYLMSLDGSDRHPITQGGQNLAPSFSPDGQWITFMSYRDRFQDLNGCEIYIMHIDGIDIRRLTNNDYCDYQPRWGP